MDSDISTKEKPIDIVSYEREFFSNIHFVVPQNIQTSCNFCLKL